MQKIKNIVFDFDGVIADSFDLIYSLCAQNAEPFTREDFLAHHDGNVWESPRVILKDENLSIQFSQYTENLSVSHVAQAIQPITSLHANGYRLFIISSNHEPAVHAVLKDANIDTCFTAVLGYETESSKIKKFNMLVDTYGINFSDSVFITDTLGDIKEANHLGITTIAETFGFHNRERLAQENPYAIVDSWDEIIFEIEKLSKSK